MRQAILRWMTVVATAFTLAACGGGAGGGTTDDASITGPPDESYAAAMEELKDGDIRSAKDYFCAAAGGGAASSLSSGYKADLDLTAIVTQSHFGCALTKMILLAESEPIIEILLQFGQPAWTVDSIFGPTGYLARAYEIHKADEVDFSITGAFDASATDLYGRSVLTTVDRAFYHSTSDELQIRASSVEPAGGYPIHMNLTVNVSPYAGYTMSGVCEVGEGDVVFPQDVCIVSDGVLDYELIVANISVTDGTYSYFIDSSNSTGSISFDRLDSLVGGVVSATFDDLVLYRNGSNLNPSITLNGRFTDTITEKRPSTDGLPFSSVCSPGRCILSQVTAGYRSTDVIESINGLDGDFNSIVSHLEAAVGDAGAYFDIPKELVYSNADIHITRADMLLLLSTMYFGKAAVNAANSWTADIALDNIVDSNGTIIADKQYVVDQLNEFFRLKDDHELTQLETNLTNAVGYLKESLDEVLGGATGGLLESTGENKQVYFESYSLVADAFDAMSGPSMVSQLDPSVGMDLTYVFEGRIDGTDIPYDPFVLEYGKIKPVEAYFSELMSSACSYDLTTHPHIEVFSQAVHEIRDLGYKLFPNIVANRIGGYHFEKDYLW